MFETLGSVLGTTEMRHPSTQEEEEGRPEVQRLGYMWRYATLVLARGRQRQVDFKISLSHMRPCLKKKRRKSREMSQWLRALAALLGDLDLSHSNDTVTLVICL